MKIKCKYIHKFKVKAKALLRAWLWLKKSGLFETKIILRFPFPVVGARLFKVVQICNLGHSCVTFDWDFCNRSHWHSNCHPPPDWCCETWDYAVACLHRPNSHRHQQLRSPSSDSHVQVLKRRLHGRHWLMTPMLAERLPLAEGRSETDNRDFGLSFLKGFWSGLGLENASNDQYLTAVHGLKGAFIVAERGFLLGPSKNVSWNLFVGCFQEKCGFIVGFRGLQFDAFFFYLQLVLVSR